MEIIRRNALNAIASNGKNTGLCPIWLIGKFAPLAEVEAKQAEFLNLEILNLDDLMAINWVRLEQNQPR